MVFPNVNIEVLMSNQKLLPLESAPNVIVYANVAFLIHAMIISNAHKAGKRFFCEELAISIRPSD